MSSSNLRLKVAQTPADFKAIHAFRFDVFFKEFGAVAHTDAHARNLDEDAFDPYCEHLMVIAPERGDRVVASTRLLFPRNLPKGGSYISEAEFDISLLKTHGANCMEVGRSCVHPDYRSGAAIQMLWLGITKYVFANDIDLMFGCASFHATDPAEIAHDLAYLHHYHRAPEALRARALRFIPMDRLPRDDIDPAAALAHLPPLIKGYLQLGGVIGDGAAFDDTFNTLDVLIMVETSKVPDRFAKHFKRLADRIDINPRPSEKVTC